MSATTTRIVWGTVPLLLAVLLTGIAVFAVEGAGCDTPGQYVLTDSGPELLGGCVAPGATPPGAAASGESS